MFRSEWKPEAHEGLALELMNDGLAASYEAANSRHGSLRARRGLR